MKSSRNNVFETNSSSSHSLSLKPRGNKYYYDLSEGGFITIKIGSYFSESSYEEFTTLETKLGFIFSMICSFIFEENWKNGIREQYILKKDLLNNKDVKEIKRILKENIKGFRGIRFTKDSFDGEFCYQGVDNHHIEGCLNMTDYCRKMGIQLDRLILSPNIVFYMNH